MRTHVPGYMLDAVIGVSESATVYRARQLRAGGRVVAVKRLREAGADVIAQLQRQGEALAELDHPNILGLLEVVRVGDGLAVVLQHAAGGSLADLLARSGPMGAAAVAAIATPIAEALGSAHRRGLLHGAVKPTNILLTGEGHPLLADFQFVRTRRPQAGAAAHSDPAVADGAELGPGTDVYALGAVCYAALAGIPPRDASAAAGGPTASEASEPRPLAEVAREVDPALIQIVTRAMAREPRLRYPDGDALATALRTASGQPRTALASTGRSAGGDGDDAAAAPPRADPGDGLSSVDGRVTREFGPRPPRPNPETLERPPVPWLRVAAAAALLLAAPPLTVTLGSGLAAATEEAARATASPAVDAGLDSRPAKGAAGAGCPKTLADDGVLGWTQVAPARCEAVRWADGTLEVADARGAVQRYALGEQGEQGDQVLVGDWSCDGVATPALYRPSTGQVFVFPRWPEAGEAEIAGRVTQRSLARGRAVVEQDTDGCERVRVLAEEPPEAASAS